MGSLSAPHYSLHFHPMASLHIFALFLHIIGITLIAGGFVGSIIAERLLWDYLKHEQSGLAAVIAPLLRRFPPVIQVGTVLMLISGLLLLWSNQWAYWGQLWFTAKLILYVLLILNGALVATPVSEKLIVLLIKPESRTEFSLSLRAALPAIRQRMYLFLLTQTAMLLVVYLLSVYKPI